MDVPMEDARVAAPQEDVYEAQIPLPLSEKEKRILELYDRLLELELELALTKARQDTTIDISEQPSHETIREAQEALLQARASWMLRNDVVSSVMMVNPVIKAAHRGTDASPIERDLLPYIEQRNEASTAIAKVEIEQQQINNDLRTAQVESIRVSRRNVGLAAEVLKLANAADQNKAEAVDDPVTKEEIARLEKELKASRQKWKVMKGTASAVVAGSGVDWVKDPVLRDIVLDPE